MTLRFGFETRGFGPLQRKFEEMGAAGQDMAPAFELIARSLSVTFMRQFATRGEHLGRRWEDLDQNTLSQRARLNQGTRPLWQTGELRDSLVSRKHHGHFELIEPHTFEYGTEVPYAAAAQTRGADRPLFVQRPTETRRWMDIMMKYIMEAK